MVLPCAGRAGCRRSRGRRHLDAETFEDLRISEAVSAWGLPSEPWVFVMDGQGRVSSRFEGALGEGEIEEALAAVGA